MNRGKENQIYKTALLLSVAVHVFFVTGAEAALILSKKIALPPTFVYVSTSAALESKVLSPPSKLKSEAIPPQPVISAPKPKRHSNVPKQVDPKIETFKKEQNELKQRVSSIKKEIIKKQVQLLQSVSSIVYDIDKIPSEMRASVLPNYLKQMRAQISTHWLLLLETVSCKSCSAIVEYRIDSNGKIFDLKLLHSSRNKAFDRACMKAITQASPLPPLPFQFKEEIKAEYLTVSLTFYYETDKPKIA